MNISDEILKVAETYISIQGEGTHTGRVMRFIRLSGCNLRCIYCDTVHDFRTDVKEYGIDEIIAIANQREDIPVYVTGGEPLIQKTTPALLDRLVRLGFEVFIDTNGTLDLSVVNQFIKKVVDIKTPGSKSGGQFLESNLKYISPHDEIKFVVTSKNDFDWAIGRIKQWDLFTITSDILIQPSWNMVDARDVVKWIIECGLPVRLSVQIHKYIWGGDVSGV